MSGTFESAKMNVPCQYWEELTIEAKIEKLAYVVENQERRINELQTMNNVQSQVKVVDGEQYVPAHLFRGGLNPVIDSKNWLFNRKPRD